MSSLKTFKDTGYAREVGGKISDEKDTKRWEGCQEMRKIPRGGNDIKGWGIHQEVGDT
jgi:hypothetical protein